MNDATLQMLATKLGTTSEYLWGVLIKQASVYIYLGTFYAFGFFILASIVLIGCLWLHQQVKDNNWDETTYIFVAFGIVAALAFILVMFAEIGSVITAIVNPEYWALDKVLTAVKGK